MERRRRPPARAKDGTLRFWDSSAVVPLLLLEPATPAIQALYHADPEMIVWWGTEVECASALAHGERERRITAPSSAEAWRRLDTLRERWTEIEPSNVVRETARRLLRVHELRVGDALQLAAALGASENRPSALEFISLDERLSRTATREGFVVLEV